MVKVQNWQKYKIVTATTKKSPSKIFAVYKYVDNFRYI